MSPYEEGVKSYLTLLYDTPIHALAKHPGVFGKEARFEFAKGFWHAYRTLNE